MSTTTLQLHFLEDSFISSNFIRIFQSKNTCRSYAFENNELYNFRIIKEGWKIEIINVNSIVALQLCHVIPKSKQEDLLVFKYPQGIRVYICDGQNLTLISAFDIIGSNAKMNYISFGNFYHDPARIGLIMGESKGDIQFYELSTETKNQNIFFRSINVNQEVLNQFCAGEKIQWMLVGLRKGLGTSLSCQHELGLSFFQFVVGDGIRHVLNIPFGNTSNDQNEKLFFPNLSRQDEWNDVVIFNSSGMFLFQFDVKTSNSYKLIHFNPMFSIDKGWTNRHTQTVRFRDIDYDGSDDIIFTSNRGIEILSYNVHANIWISLLTTESLRFEQRHAMVMEVLSGSDENIFNTILLLHHSNRVHLAKIVEIPLELIEIPKFNKNIRFSLNTDSLVPTENITINTTQPNSKSVIFLRDQNIPIDQLKMPYPHTGKPKFVLPLVGETSSAVKFHLYYDGQATSSEPFGVGWYSPQNYIILYFDKSNFEEDEYYVLMLDNVPHKLKMLPAKSTNETIISYEVEGNAMHIQAHYDSLSNQWEIDYGFDYLQYYGRYDYELCGAVVTDSSWINWRGTGIDETARSSRVYMWYLAAVNQNGEIKTSFEYLITTESDSNNPFTERTTVHLSKIHNSFESIIFNYSDFRDKYNKKTFNQLTDLIYTSENSQQIVIFKHSIMDGSLLLNVIEQKLDYIAQPVMQFKYLKFTNERYCLKRIILPKGNEIEYSYTFLGTSTLISEQQSLKVPVSDDYNVSYGPDFTLITYIEKDLKQIILRMFSKDLTVELYSSLQIVSPSKGRWPILGDVKTVEAFEILLANSFVAVIVYTPTMKSTYVFGRLPDDSWQTTPQSYNNSNDSVTLKGTDFILISDPISNVTVINWMPADNIWKSTFLLDNTRTVTSVGVHETKIVIYNNVDIFLVCKNITNQWKKYKLKHVHGYLSETRNVIRKFRLRPEFEKSLFGFFRNNAIQISHNIVTLSGLIFNHGTVFKTKIVTFIIGRDHEVKIEKRIIVIQDYLTELSSNEEVTPNGVRYTLTYVYKSGVIRLKLKTLNNSPEKSFQQFDREIAKDMNFPAKRFLLDLKNYYVTLRGQAVMCRDIAYIFGGSRWHRLDTKTTTNNESIPIGHKFFAYKINDESSFKLYNKDKSRVLFDFGVKDINDLKIHYPIYIAAQTKGQDMKILEFIDGNELPFTHATLSKTNQLSPFSSATTLVTDVNDSQGKKNLSLWSIHGPRHFFPDNVISLVKVTFSDPKGRRRERMTVYKYSEDSAQLIGDNIFYTKTNIFPGNNKSAYGYVTITDQFVEFFNNKDELVKKDERNNTENLETGAMETEEKLSKDESLFDKRGRFEIARLTPFSLTSNMFGFIGFEDYEDIDNFDWFFNKQNIIRGRFSLTGRNYLHLKDESLLGNFIPQFQDRKFIASAWIRTPAEKSLMLGDIVPHMWASVLSNGNNELEIINLLADVKYQINDWFYLEVIVDLLFTRLVLEAANQFQSKNFKIQIHIAAVPHVPIDVDHVRFISLNNIFNINVYDDILGKLIAIIRPNGAIIRRFYDNQLRQIAETNEANQIKEFHTNSKTCGHLRNPDCTVKLIPEGGFYEDFSLFAIRKQWRFSRVDTWTISSPGTLQHHTASLDELLLSSEDVNFNSFSIRFWYLLQANDSYFIVGNSIQVGQSENRAEIKVLNKKVVIEKIPVEGEFLLLKVESRIIIWIDGCLYFDEHLLTFDLITFSVKGDVQLQHLMILSRPQVHVTYKNTLNEEIQLISLCSPDTIVVKEKLYDELGRQSIIIQPVEIKRTPDQSLLSYVTTLVTNDNPLSANDSVWSTGQLKGEINNIVGHKFGFSQILYDKNPLNVKRHVTMIGEKLTTTRILTEPMTANSFLESRYPPSEKYTYKVVRQSMHSETTSIFDERNLKVALYHRVIGGRDRFSTFEYNENRMLTQCLPPMYYDEIGIFNETNGNLIDISIANEEEKLKLGLHFVYDSRDNLISKKNPDTGLLQYVYDSSNRLRFLIQHKQNNSNITEQTIITYFMYNEFGRVSSTGLLKQEISKHDELLNLTITDDNADEFQYFHYSEFETEPALRGNIQRTITKNQDETIFEESVHNVDSKVVSKRYLIPNGSDSPTVLSIDKHYEGDKLKEILLPATMFGEAFRVAYDYDILGRVQSVGIAGQSERFVIFTYNANNQIVTETFNPLHRSNKFIRTYEYNDFGFLVKVDDPFYKEELSYRDKSYSHQNMAGGTISRIKFTAKWQSATDFLVEAELDKNQQNSINSDVFPMEYGFLFNYGNQMELKAAKYFVGNIDEQLIGHLQADTFSNEIPSIGVNESQQISELLISSGYILKNKINGRGRDFIRKTLEEDLKSLRFDFNKYGKPLRKLLLWIFVNRKQDFSLTTIVGKWRSYFVFSNSSLEFPSIYEMLLNKNYFRQPLDSQFVNILKDYINHIPEIVGIMEKYFAMELGTSRFDMESCEIDSNGNHLQFYVGFEYYKINYIPKSNRILEIIHQKRAENKEKTYRFQYDSRGNVIQALHKSILQMKYHPVSNRLEKVLMTNGNCVTFSYDSKGERMSKRVFDGNGQIVTTRLYLRDEKGRTLVERTLTYFVADRAPDVRVTVYIYGGGNSLIGFVRRDQFYSVACDHQGSVRLIIRDGEVVAAYDYMPYGELIRIYGSDFDAHISYRYTGQEWDAEIGLYNYHARFYDPTIGRFYQIDPVLQYFSPYKYAGNSPVAMADTSGELAFLVFAVIGLGLLGAYLGGAASNGNLNPTEWDESSAGTYLGIFVGGATGAMLPFGFLASMAAAELYLSTFTSATLVTSVGLGTAYLSASAANAKWNPLNWNLTSPKTWNAAFEGLSMGIGSIGGVYGAISTFIKLRNRYKYIFGGAVALFGSRLFIFGGIDTNWNVGSPVFWLSSITSVLIAADIPMIVKSGLNFFRKHTRRFQLGFYISRNDWNDYTRAFTELRRHGMSTRQAAMDIYRLNASLRVMLKSGAKLLIATAGFSFLSYILGSLMMGDFGNWDLTHATTYHNLLAAAQLTAQVFSTSKDAFLSNELTPRLSQYNAHSVRLVVGDMANIHLQVMREGSPAPSEITSMLQSTVELREAKSEPIFILTTNLSLLVKLSHFSLIYTWNEFTNPQFILTTAASKKLNDFSLAKNLANAVIHVNGRLRDEFKTKYRNESIPDWLSYKISTETIFDQNTITRCVETITNLFESNLSQMKRDLVKSEIEMMNLENPESRIVKEKYTNKENELNDLKSKLIKNNLTYKVRGKLLDRKKYLGKTIKMLKINELLLKADHSNALVDIFWDNLKEYQQQLNKWQYPNKVINRKDPIRKYVPNPSLHNGNYDFKYLSYEDLPEFSIFQRCYNCIKVASRFLNKVKDMEWLALFKTKSTKHNQMLLEPMINECRMRSAIELEERVKQKILKTNKRKRRAISQPYNFNSNFEKLNAEQRIWNIQHVNNNSSSQKQNYLSVSLFNKATNFLNTSWNMLNIGDTFLHHMANNESLLLVDFVLAKCNKRNLYKSTDINENQFQRLIEHQIIVCEIIQLYEEILRVSAEAADIMINRLDMSSITVLYNVIKEIVATNKFDDLSDLLIKYALNALPKTCMGRAAKLSCKKRTKFETSLYNFKFHSKIDAILIRLNRLRRN